jgi:cytochrome c oxidase subunit IV
MAERGDIARQEHEAEIAHSHAGRYAIVWIALAVLTAVTYAVSRLHIEGAWGITVALLIASVKGGLVALFFMHLWDQRGANRLVFVTSLVFVALLVGIVLSDNATRFRLANPPGTDGALPLDATDYAGPPRAPPQAAPRPH